LLSSCCHGSKRIIEEFVETVFHVPFSLGTIANLEQEMSGALSAPDQEAEEDVRAAPVKNADETSWKQAGKKRWLWLAAVQTAACFKICLTRSQTALRELLGEKDTALVIGCGAIGLLTIAALRATGCPARIVAVAKYDHQREHARRLGANEFLSTGGSTWDRYAAWAKSLDAEVFKPELGKPTVIGGATAVFDCVASSQSIDDGIRFTRSGGTFVLIGMPGMPNGVDWTPMWFKELTVHAAYAYGPERTAGSERETFDWAIELVHAWAAKLTPLVGEPFALSDYRGAIESALNTGRSGAAKTVICANDRQGCG
jgi:threonine dehydrogenase-like Zn-dependent dehydrogenase